MDEPTGARAWPIVGVAVRRPTRPTSEAYATKYGLAYTIAFDATADVLHLYRVYGLPTQVFIGPDGRHPAAFNGPMTAHGRGSPRPERRGDLPAPGRPIRPAG